MSLKTCFCIFYSLNSIEFPHKIPCCKSVLCSGTISSQSVHEGTSFDSDTESVVSSISDFEIGQGKKRKNFTKLLGGVAKVIVIFHLLFVLIIHKNLKK